MTILTGGASIRLSTLERELGKPSMAYLAGPMRGIEDFNYPAFNAAAERLRSGGWWILNPAETDATVKEQAEKSDNPLAVYMEQDLADVCSADVIFCLDGWEGSEGASLEVDVARRLGKRLYTFPRIEPLDGIVSRILDYVKPSGDPVVKEVDGVRADAREIREPFPSFDLCVCGTKTRAEGHCSCEPEPSCESTSRTFSTGATRDTEHGKLDYEGFLSPLVLERFAEYMDKHRTQADGTLRSSDNWQKGIPRDAYMKSLWRHFMEVWKEHRLYEDSYDEMEEALCAVMFNTMGFLYEIVRCK